MPITFRVGNYIDPSGFGIAVVDIPAIGPNQNISLVDYSHKWEENVASSDRYVIRSYVDSGGHMPPMTITDFLVTNVTTTSTNDMVEAQLYYRHRCRFHHYTYGEDPGRQVYITDQNENILKDMNYTIKSERVSNNVYRIDILTDFTCNESSIYKVKYNRCTSDGLSIYPGWVETLNAFPLFRSGSPFTNSDEYSLIGPDINGNYNAVVPPVPTLTPLVSSVGISFDRSPTLLSVDVTNNVTEYAVGVIVQYTLKALSPTTFSVKRNKNIYGAISDEYLQSSTADSWGGSEFAFTIGTQISSIYGMRLNVHGDNYLKTGDEAYFTARRSYYYLMPLSYSSIYLKKPDHVTTDDDWYIRVKNGRFRRRMNSAGEVVPSGVGTLWEYAVPDYSYQMFDVDYGPPYKESLNERVEVLDAQTIQFQRTPLWVDPSAITYATVDPGFVPSGFITVHVNDVQVGATGILDWDIYNGTVKLAQTLTHRDDVIATYKYEEKFYDYTGFVAVSGIYPTTPAFWGLDLNPTPAHNYGMYGSGLIASIFLKPYMNVDTGTVVNWECLYHNFTDIPLDVIDFKLGSITLGPSCKIGDLQITDVRTRGGGLSKLGVDNIDQVKQVQGETEFFWDVGYFDGKAVPTNGVLVVKIPKTVLKVNGGSFEEDEVRQKVLKHLALGEYAILEYT